jgi:hypothetical protein
MVYFVAKLIGTVLLVAIPTAIVYWRNKGQLSIGKSYMRALLHVVRVTAWGIIVVGVILTAASTAALLGTPFPGNWPWWSIFFCLGFVGVGYGIQRLARFVLNDADWNNMFASKDR